MVGRCGRGEVGSGSPAAQWMPNAGKFVRTEQQRSAVAYVGFDNVREGIGSIREEEEGGLSPLHTVVRSRETPHPISCSPPIDIPIPKPRSPLERNRSRDEDAVLDERFFSARSYMISGDSGESPEYCPVQDEEEGGDQWAGARAWRDDDLRLQGVSAGEDEPREGAAHHEQEEGVQPSDSGGIADGRMEAHTAPEGRSRPPRAHGKGVEVSDEPVLLREAAAARSGGVSGNRNLELHESLLPQIERGGQRRSSVSSGGLRGSPVSSEDGMGSSQKGSAPSTSSFKGDRRGGPLSRVGSTGSLSSWSRYLSPSRIVSYISNLPLHIRGRAEAWETSRDEIVLLEEVGRGQTGVVHRCIWRRLECAAKILSPTQGCNTVEYQDMVNEISTVSHLRHPNLVLFLGACTQGDGPLLLLNEFMTGGSLEQRFSSKKREHGRPWRCPRTLALKWIRDMSRAVHFLHQCCPPIIHRDLKPANILLTEQDVLKIGDFGLSKVIKKAGERSGAGYKMTGEAGTMRYMAPEVVRSEPYYDQKVDIYSMGMIFWYILTGERPFEGVRPAQIARQASKGHVRPPLDCVQWSEMEAIIQLMWSDSPDTRPSGGEILNEIEEIIANGGDKKGCFKSCLGL